MQRVTIDGNGAVARVSYAFTEVAAIYPITPSSPMAELCDLLASKGEVNLFGNVPDVVQMQSEAGAAGVLHGAATCGTLATTYTCSQGLLLMLPAAYKLAGELLPAVFHVSARALSTHALSIFGDHQDVMACRATGLAMLVSSSVQEAADFALVAHLSALKTSLPFLHFFDGFRTSHEYDTIELPDEAELRSFLPKAAIERFRRRALTPNAPVQRGTAQNPDVYFQNREAANGYYAAAPKLVEEVLDEVAAQTGRRYHLFDYFGAKDAKYVLVLMGSGATMAEETAKQLAAEGEKVGVVKVRLYRPFAAEHFLAALPKTCERIAVLDRTKEAGASGEPLYLDVCAALRERKNIQVVGGRYGLSSKNFTPSDVFAVFQNLQNNPPKHPFTVGIADDLTHLSLPKTSYRLNDRGATSCVFYGLGSDGTVGANKESAKILGSFPNLYAQAYFHYDSKKSGGVTISHLRVSHAPVHAPYEIETPDFVACHQANYLSRYDLLEGIKTGGVFLLNCPWKTDEEVLQRIPARYKCRIAERKLRFFVIDADSLADEVGLRGKTGGIMQAAFFLLTEILPFARALEKLKTLFKEKFQSKGDGVAEKNVLALEKTRERVRLISYPDEWASAQPDDKPKDETPLSSTPEAEEYFRRVSEPVLALHGNDLPVSAFTADGSVPTGTSRLHEKGAPPALPVWLPEYCIQCNRCAFVCPHAVIRPILLKANAEPPESFRTLPAVGAKEARFRIQIAPRQCTGCGACVEACPSKTKALVFRPSNETLEIENKNYAFALQTKDRLSNPFPVTNVKGSQFQTPLFEFSHACPGCGETAYIKLLTQLFGERAIIANATGCSSIYGGSSPTCPYAVNEEGKGPAWASSLFENAAEFGLGMRLATKQRGKEGQSVWVVGGDGWAYDIGYGGLEHLLSLHERVRVLVLDTEVYSNTGGQKSKATPLGAKARFAPLGKRTSKKQLAANAILQRNAYVAQVCLGTDMQQTLNAFLEAEAYDGPSVVVAYCPCIEHGVDLRLALQRERLAVESGFWQLFRFQPDRSGTGKSKLKIDSKPPCVPLREFFNGENRFAALLKSNPDAAEQLFAQAERESHERARLLQTLREFFDGE